MNIRARCCSPAALAWVGVIGVFLVMAVIVAALKHYTRPEPIDGSRAAERREILAEVRQQATTELTTAAWINREQGVVRLPHDVAVALAIQHWQDPARARAELLARAEKAFYVPPPPPEAPSEFE